MVCERRLGSNEAEPELTRQDLGHHVLGSTSSEVGDLVNLLQLTTQNHPRIRSLQHFTASIEVKMPRVPI